MIDLRGERHNRGLSLGGAAAQMGVDQNTLSRAERGEAIPVPRNALKIASFYGYQVTDVWPLEPIARETSELAEQVVIDAKPRRAA